MAYLYITYKDYEGGPRGHLGLSWRSGRCRRLFEVTDRAAARAKVSEVESQGRRWGRTAVVHRVEDETLFPRPVATGKTRSRL